MQRAKHPRQLKNKVKLKTMQHSYLIQCIRESANCNLIGLSRIGLFVEEWSASDAHA